MKPGSLKLNFLEMAKLGLVLALFAAAACVMLAFVYDYTSDIIEKNAQAALEEALDELFPDADEFKQISDITSPDPAVTIETAYAAIKNEEVIGAALGLSRPSYSGPIKTMVGISASGFVTGVKILEHSDTPGLGANATSDKYFVDRARGITFYGQFAGKRITDPFAVNDDVIIITASTITSVAVSASVKAAGLAFNAWFMGEEQ